MPVWSARARSRRPWAFRAWPTPAELAAHQEARLRRLIEHATLTCRTTARCSTATASRRRRSAPRRPRPRPGLVQSRPAPPAGRRAPPAAGLHPTGSPGPDDRLQRRAVDLPVAEASAGCTTCSGWAVPRVRQRLGDRVVWVSAQRPRPAPGSRGSPGARDRAGKLRPGRDHAAGKAPTGAGAAAAGGRGRLPRHARPPRRATAAERRADIRPRFVLAGGEVLTGARRAQIEATWGVPAHEVYSCWEMGLLAWACPSDRPLPRERTIRSWSRCWARTAARSGWGTRRGRGHEPTQLRHALHPVPHRRHRHPRHGTLRLRQPVRHDRPGSKARMLDFFGTQRPPAAPVRDRRPVAEDGWVGQIRSYRRPRTSSRPRRAARPTPRRRRPRSRRAPPLCQARSHGAGRGGRADRAGAERQVPPRPARSCGYRGGARLASFGADRLTLSPSWQALEIGVGCLAALAGSTTATAPAGPTQRLLVHAVTSPAAGTGGGGVAGPAPRHRAL